ncbi:MAG: hypothetical protein ACTSR5_11340 [Promethearchaeota archaeon]
MPIYMLATKLQNPNLVEKRKETGEKWLKIVKEKLPGIKWIAHYAILGPYDFIDITHVTSTRSCFCRKLDSHSIQRFPWFDKRTRLNRFL